MYVKEMNNHAFLGLKIDDDNTKSRGCSHILYPIHLNDGYSVEVLGICC